MSKSIVVIGAGPGIGLAVARQWGHQGYQVALVARQAERLAQFVDLLLTEGIEVAAFPTDVTNSDELVATLTAINDRFGSIDALYFGPPATAGTMAAPRSVTVEKLEDMFGLVYAAVTAVQFVLPGMLAQHDGTIMFCVPMSAIEPVLFSSNYAMACAALRNYADALYVDLHAEGVHVGVVTIAGLVVEGDSERRKSLDTSGRRPGDRAWDEYRAFHEDLAAHVAAPDVADAFWKLSAGRHQLEIILGNPGICGRLRAQAMGGTPAS